MRLDDRGQLVAAGMTMVNALIGVGVGLLGLLLAGHQFDMTVLSPVFHGEQAVALYASTCHVLDVGGLRLPLVEVDDDEREHVRAALARHGLLRETSPA